jgi:NRAMP (natural resistance-associated macrophage protein)-like metal ion transporter
MASLTERDAPEHAVDRTAATEAPLSGMRRFWRTLGPGLITGAADDDPSGITTYSLAGAQFGTSLLWMAVVSWPLMWAVQLMCARIGMVTGRGLMAAMRQRFPRPVLFLICGALAVANGINIGADLDGMADAAELLSGVNSHVWVLLFGVGITLAAVKLRYALMSKVLKWLALVLGAYVITALLSKPDYAQVLRDTLVPRLPTGADGWGMVVAILGTTISPYLFFWQASEEVEEEKERGRERSARIGATAVELQTRNIDVGVGTFVSNAAMFFIMLTTALTLHAHGILKPQTSAEVAKALEPFAGRSAMLLYTIGLFGLGALAIPTLAGATAYAFAELLGLRQGIDADFNRARAFYGIMIVSVLGGITMDFLKIDAVRALYLTAVINGLVAPPLLVGIVLVARDAKLMRNQPSSRWSAGLVWVTTALMIAAGVAMFAM